MSRGHGYVQDVILHALDEHPEGFELNPEGAYCESAQAARRRAAYSLEREGLVCLKLGERRGRCRPLLVYPPDVAGADKARRERRELAERSQTKRAATIGHQRQRAVDGARKARVRRRRAARADRWRRPDGEIRAGGRSFDEENLRALKIRDPQAWQAAVVGTDVFRQYWRRPSRWTKEGNPVDSSPCQWAQFVYNESVFHDPRNPSDVRNFFNPVAACLAHLLPLVAQAFDGATRHPGELGIDHRKALTDVAIRWFGTLPHTLVSLASSISMSDEQRRSLYSAIRDVRRDLDRLELLARPNGPAGIRQEPYGADAAVAGSGR